MTRSHRGIFALVCAGFVPFVVVACKKDPPPAPAVEVPPPAPVASQVELAPLIDDAGPDVIDASDAAPKKTGTGVTANVSRAKQCCAAMRSQAKQLGASPEAAQLQALAGTCDTFAAQLGPNAGPQAPELAPLRALLQGKTLPAVCQGL